MLRLVKWSVATMVMSAFLLVGLAAAPSESTLAGNSNVVVESVALSEAEALDLLGGELCWAGNDGAVIVNAGLFYECRLRFIPPRWVWVYIGPALPVGPFSTVSD